ncbi:SH3 domain-containing protein [Thermodesulfobacteriota bacterium]
MRRIFIIASLLLFVQIAPAFCSDSSSLFLTATKAYEDGEYEKSAENYELLLNHVKNGNLYYNLANSYFKQGKIGYALLNYSRAKKYDPADGDINDNIGYVKTLTKDKIEDKRSFSFIYKIFFYYDFFNNSVFFYILTAFNILFFVALIVRFYTKRSYVDFIKNAILCLLIIFSIGYVLNYKVYCYDEKGVVVSSEISVKSGTSMNDTVLFNLHEGSEFKVIKSQGDWYKIELLDKKKGWVSNKNVELI